METLFILDEGGYSEGMELISRYASRAVIVGADGRIAMQRDKNGEYKLPGGGIEPGEDEMEALCREVSEETGMTVIRDSVREIGVIIERRRDIYSPEKRYESHSYCYFCSCEQAVGQTSLTEHEQYHGYKLEWASFEQIMQANTRYPWSQRDTRLLALLRERGEI